MNKSDFKILSEQVYGKRLVYLDNAATTQKPEVVIQAIEEAYHSWNANIHRGVHHLSQVATEKHEQARQKMADYIGATSSKEIVFTKGTTDSLNMLARCFENLKIDGQNYLGAGDEIWLSEVEHHSNIVPWQMVCERRGCKIRVFKLGEVPTLSEQAKVVSVAYVSNVLGEQNDIEKIAREAKKWNIPVIVDAAQAVAHRTVDVQSLGCDFLAFSGHKMYGPTGIGVLWGKEQWLDILPPAEGGGEMIEHVSWEKTTYNTLPYKFEAGTPNFVGSYALGVAADYIRNIGMEKIAKYEEELCCYAEQKLRKIEGVKVYGEGLKHGVISFNAYNANGKLIHPYDIGTLLDRQGVAVRTGHHCAEPLIDSLGVPGTVRISFALYNDQEDIDIAMAALRRALTMLG